MVNSVKKLNFFVALNLPSAFLCGVRIKSINQSSCITSVRYKWINKNPFKSMYWAVQGMSAELATGALIIIKLKELNKKISMLVVSNDAKFIKKGRGVIKFKCDQGFEIDKALKNAIETKESQTIILNADGIDSKGDVISKFSFTWSLKLKP